MTKLSDDLASLSADAYTYLYSLVTMDVSRRQQTSPGASERPGFGPANQFHHLLEFPPADFRAVVRPNFDTLYSSAWLDLTGGPVLIEVPDSDGRYYMLPMLDMWTDVFASPGKRTSGTDAQRYVVALREHDTSGIADAEVITAPTPFVWVIGRTQTNGPADYPSVNAFQQGLSVTALGTPATTAEEPVDPTAEPLRIVNAMSAVEFFGRAAEVLKVVPPHVTDNSVLMRISGLGLVPGRSFDASRFGTDEIAEIERGAKSALAAITDVLRLGRVANGWEIVTKSIGVYGIDYLARSQVTLVGLGANPPEDAIYPLLLTDSDGEPLSGENDYRLHFAAGELPPVDAFWSVTMYDAEGYQVGNEINRFAIGDRDSLRFNDDGSLDLYLQHTNPGPDLVDNWLPTPRGRLGVTLRLYAPQQAALTGAWNPPAVQRA
ncbi:DUF1254 domain-containing protein [Gordonia McavH-238-E]|uniref:DUF1254 domain-containing protein n=1 Tax=Gordonia sp. McavH-238-E TaxID=2917736 RepID=UPI001EF4D9A3|nr:DUF1254 domain-containing protein [Gordonia sp. McavH-238-E]MCG7635441.1 DUF1254 domain-containing protein [Gordonia sp. McavH-238-E]